MLPIDRYHMYLLFTYMTKYFFTIHTKTDSFPLKTSITSLPFICVHFALRIDDPKFAIQRVGV